MKFQKIIVLTFLLMCVVQVNSQYLNNSILKQWTNKDSKYNSPQNRNPLLPGYYADPTIIEDNGTFYMYATSDLTSWDSISKMAVWSSVDLTNWTCKYLNWPTKEQCQSNTGMKDGVWAPSVVKGKNGKFYMYVTIGREIWAGIADAPGGPWKNARADDQPLIRHKEYNYVETIDAECFIDDDGQAYLYWGSTDLSFDIEGRCLVVKLNIDMASFTETPRDVTPPHYFEAPYMLKRNHKYYLMYSWGHTWDKTYQVRYATGDSPYGPWQEGPVRPILVANEKDETITSTGHHTILHFQNNYYIIYHRFNTLNYAISRKLRQVCADELTFNTDGYLQHVVSTNKGITLPVTNKLINIAFGARAYSSSDLDTICKASYANDENNGTLWIGGTMAEEWLQLDFEKIVPVEKIEVYPEFPIYAYHYKIDISNNGTEWRTVDDGMENETIGSPISLQKKLQARFVRIKMANHKNLPRPGIWEVKVYKL